MLNENTNFILQYIFNKINIINGYTKTRFAYYTRVQGARSQLSICIFEPTYTKA